MIAPILLAAVLAQPFTAFSGTGQIGSGETPRRKTVAMYGDSLIQGSCSPTPPPNVLDGLLPGGSTNGYVVVNRGIAGETAHEIAVRIQSGATTACLGGTCGTYMVEGLVNTLKGAEYAEYAAAAVAAIAVHGSSAANSGTCNTAVANDCGLMDSVDWLHAHQPQARIFAIGVLPYASCSNAVCPSLVEPGPRAVAADALLAAACATRPWLTCVFPYNSFREGTTHNLATAYACADDNIHLKQAGSDELGRQVFVSATW